MELGLIFAQLIVGLGILNVWLIRRNKNSAFRGGHSQTMEEEFQFYGLPTWSVPIVGFFKVSLAILVLAGFFNPEFTAIGAFGLGLFMFGAVIMHLKVQDSLIKIIPSITVLALCVLLAVGSSPDILSIASL